MGKRIIEKRIQKRERNGKKRLKENMNSKSIRIRDEWKILHKVVMSSVRVRVDKIYIQQITALNKKLEPQGCNRRSVTAS